MTSATPGQSAISVNHVTKRFAGITALDDVSLDFFAGEVHCVIGENGAGKSTLMKIIAGVYKKDAGRVYYSGREIDLKNMREARSLGTAIIFQEPGIVSSLSVGENIFLNDEKRFHVAGFLATWKRNEEAARALREIGRPDIDVQARVVDLPFEDWKIVELARALTTTNLRVLVVDEATAALGQNGQAILFEQIRRLKREGVAILYISHRLKEIFEIGDRITVMKDAKVVTTKEASACRLEELPRLMVGRDVSEYYSRGATESGPDSGEPVLRVEQLSVADQIHDVSFDLHRGEILGIAGLVGSGMHVLGRALFGAAPFKGRVVVKGQAHTSMTPQRAISLGIGFIPRERDKEGLVLVHSVSDNMALPNLRSLLNDKLPLFVSGRKKRVLAEQFRRELSIKTPSVKLVCNALSGGNRQKVVLAKWLARNVSVLVMACPTRGIDVGAKAEIYSLMEKLREQGVAIIMISEELPELLGMSDRIIIIKEGRIAGTLNRESAPTEEAIAAQMM